MSHAWLARWALVVACYLSGTATIQAQGLLWSLPEDGTWVKYTGEVTTKQERPGNNDGPLIIKRQQELLIQSVGTETVDVEGVPTACRWIEFKLVTGTPAQGGAQAGIDPGPNGTRIYKVLIPEDRVTGKLKDNRNLPITHIPIIKGLRKLGDRDPEPVQEKVLQTFPMLALFGNYAELTEEGAAEDLDLPGYGSVSGQKHTGVLKQQNNVNRSENTGEIWLSPDVPFGWAKLHVKIVREWKRANAPEEEFVPAAETEVEWAAVEKETGAKSELGDVSAAE